MISRDIALVDDLRAGVAESPCVEFKHNNDDPEMIGKLVSALSNAARACGEEIAWGADSELVYYAMRLADKNEALSTNLDIYVSHQNYDTAENQTPGNKATDTLPAPSPDGKYLAWAAMARPSTWARPP